MSSSPSQKLEPTNLGLGVKDFYAGKTLLITGTTGFVGKVVLEKIIRTMPDFKKIFVMIRAKKNLPLFERLERQVFSSAIFAPLFKADPDLKRLLREKVVPVAGDLIVNELGMSQEDRARVTVETEIIINCAASVSFDDPLLDAIQINYFGCKRMLELALQCQKIRCFTHVSTAYVNCNMLGNPKVEEKVYDLPGGQDPEQVIADIIRLGPQRVQEQERAILGLYPNTYTFTKALAERMIKNCRGTLPVVILRPSVI